MKDLHSSAFKLQDQITEKLEPLSEELRNEIRIVPDIQISFKSLLNEKEFNKVCSAKEEAISPRWTFDIDCHVVEEKEVFRFSLQLVNNTPVPKGQKVGYIPKLFDAGISVVGNENVEFEYEIKLPQF